MCDNIASHTMQRIMNWEITQESDSAENQIF